MFSSEPVCVETEPYLVRKRRQRNVSSMQVNVTQLIGSHLLLVFKVDNNVLSNMYLTWELIETANNTAGFVTPYAFGGLFHRYGHVLLCAYA